MAFYYIYQKNIVFLQLLEYYENYTIWSYNSK